MRYAILEPLPAMPDSSSSYRSYNSPSNCGFVCMNEGGVHLLKQVQPPQIRVSPLQREHSSMVATIEEFCCKPLR